MGKSPGIMRPESGRDRRLASEAARRPSPRGVLELDRLVHEQTRLGIVSALAANQPLSFNDLNRILKTTDGNLSVHARKLEAADYIACRKFFQGRTPKTEYRLTALGRAALERYVERMAELIEAVRVR